MLKRMGLGFLTVGFLLLMVNASWAVVLTFEDTDFALNGSTGWTSDFQSEYGGLLWSSSWGIYHGPTMNSGYDAGTVSGEYALFNEYGNPVSVSIASGYFDWEGAWFASTRETGGSIDVYGYRNGTEVYHGVITLTWESPVWFDAGWTAVDEVYFAGAFVNDSKRLTLDDFTYSVSTTPVPEPGTIMLLGAGLLGLAAVRRQTIGV